MVLTATRPSPIIYPVISLGRNKLFVYMCFIRELKLNQPRRESGDGGFNEFEIFASGREAFVTYSFG